MTCEHCGGDCPNSTFPDCDCMRRNAPVSAGEWVTMIGGFGLLILFIVLNLT